MFFTSSLANCRLFSTVQAQSRLIAVDRRNKKWSKPHQRKERIETGSISQAKKSDDFGQLAPTPAILKSEYLPDDDDGYDVLEKKERLRSLGFYNHIFNKLRWQGGHDRAKQMYDYWVQMRQDDRIGIPQKPHYSMMIATLANSGLTDKAFHLFKEFTRAKRFPTQSMITSLFNACGESYDKDEGLSYAHYLRDWLYEKSYTCNPRQYNAMIKAFARNGDLKMSFSVLNEMVAAGHQPDDYTFNMLLMGAICDKESGCGHAIRIVRERLKRLPLNEPALRLLLRSIKECQVGSVDHLANLLQIDELKKLKSSFAESLTTQMLSSDNFSLLNTDNSDESSNLWPLFQIRSLETPADRLVLVGGLSGVLKLITKFKIQCTPALLTSLLECLPPQNESEDELIRFISNHRFCKVDTGFFNALIKRRALRVDDSNDQSAVQSALQQMLLFKLQPDIITFGSLAIACRTPKQRRQFLNDMEESGFKVNSTIINTLIVSSLRKTSFPHLQFLLKQCLKDEITLTPQVLERIQVRIEDVRKRLLDRERGIGGETSPNFERGFDDFVEFFEKNLQCLKVEFEADERDQFDFEIAKHRRAKLDESMESILKSQSGE